MKVATLLSLGLSATFARAASPILGQYWPAYNSELQSVREIPFSYSSKNGLAFYFVTETDKNGFSLPEYQSTADIKAFVASAKQHGVRPLYSVGGWTGSIHFSDHVATSAGRTKLAQQMHVFLTKYGFEGVDLDWEYPNGEGIGCNSRRPEDSANLLAFLKVLRAKIGRKKLITAAVSTAGFLGPDGDVLPDLKPFSRYLDYINLMTYDIAGSWSPTTGPNSPLRKCNSDTSVQTAVKLWTSRGFPASKILLGIPAYAISFTTKSSNLESVSIAGGKWNSKAYQDWTGVVPRGGPSDVNASSTDPCGNTSSGYSGQWLYKELISEGILSKDGQSGLGGYKRYYDGCSMAPFLFNAAKKHYISYEDSKSAALKAEWAVKQGLAGVFLFDTTGFDSNVYEAISRSLCTFPLRSARGALLARIGKDADASDATSTRVPIDSRRVSTRR